MNKYTEQNKIAWEYDAYNFWVNQLGTPAERAKKDLENPRVMLKKYSKYFDDVKGIKQPTFVVPAVKKQFRWPCWVLQLLYLIYLKII